MTRLSKITLWSAALALCVLVVSAGRAEDSPAAESQTNDVESAEGSEATDGGNTSDTSDTPAPDAVDQAGSEDGDSTRIELRYRVTDDEILRYRSVKVGELSYTVGELTKTDVERVEQVRRFEVRSVDDDGCADLVMQFESVEMSLQSNGGTPLVYRSSMEPSEVPDIFAGLDARLRGDAPRFRVTPVGAPLDANRQIMIPQVTKNPEGNDSQPKTNPPETRLMLPLPEAPVQVGDTWKYFSRVTVRISEDFKREVPLLTSCRLESVDNGIARINFSTSPAVRLKSVAAKAQLVSALPRGYCLLDLEKGRIIKRVSRNSSNVHGVYGAQSLLTYSAEVVEELLPEGARLSQR